MITAATNSPGHIISRLMQNSSVLLVITGTLIGLNFPLGKVASQAGIQPMLWAFLISLGAMSISLPMLIARGEFGVPSRQIIRYALISAVISFVTPNLLLFTVIPYVGAGYSGLMFSLSPVFTMSLAILFRLRIPSRLGLLGIFIGLIGAVFVSLTRSADMDSPEIEWLLAAMFIPVALAAGNVYRTIDWPELATPNMLAFWSHAFSSMVFLLMLWAVHSRLPFDELLPAVDIAFLQILIAGITFPVFYRLQQYGGPVILSQIGYVAAAVGLIFATVFLGEQYSATTWWGAMVIAIGIMITITAQIHEHRIPVKNQHTSS